MGPKSCNSSASGRLMKGEIKDKRKCMVQYRDKEEWTPDTPCERNRKLAFYGCIDADSDKLNDIKYRSDNQGTSSVDAQTRPGRNWRKHGCAASDTLGRRFLNKQTVQCQPVRTRGKSGFVVSNIAISALNNPRKEVDSTKGERWASQLEELCESAPVV